MCEKQSHRGLLSLCFDIKFRMITDKTQSLKKFISNDIYGNFFSFTEFVCTELYVAMDVIYKSLGCFAVSCRLAATLGTLRVMPIDG